MRESAQLRVAAVALAAVILLSGCAGDGVGDATTIEVSGSSTVAPITAAMATQGHFAVNVVAEGTIDGFERFCAGETAINNASEAIPGAGQPTDYVAMCEANGVEYLELPIALDALTIVRNTSNDFALDLTVAELRAIWEPGSTVQQWADVRAGWPERDINLYGRPDGSGTLDFFTNAIVGEAGAIRDDYRATDDTNKLAQWLADDPDGLGFMGVGNYLAADGEWRDRLTNVDVEGVSPSREAAQDGTYQPLTRPLLLYVSKAEFDARPEVREFVSYYVTNVEGLLPRVYFYALPHDVYPLLEARVEAGTTGTIFGGDPFARIDLVEALRG